MIIELRGVQVWSKIVLVISNHSHDFGPNCTPLNSIAIINNSCIKWLWASCRAILVWNLIQWLWLWFQITRMISDQNYTPLFSLITIINYFMLISFQSPCSSYPCQNAGACETNCTNNTFKCICENGFTGEYCEKGNTVKHIKIST